MSRHNFDGHWWIETDHSSIDVDQDKIKAVDGCFIASKSSKPPECKEKGCTNPATHGADNSQAKAKWCTRHKKEGDVEVGCSLCPGKADVKINDTAACLAHAVLEVRTLRESDTPITITSVRGSNFCACGTRAMYTLSNDEKKKKLACKQCSLIWGLLLGVEFVDTAAPPDMSARACVGPACARVKQGMFITSEEKRYCATHRDKVITDEKAENKPFGERTTFKYAPCPCQGKQCTVTECDEESVCDADDKALCLEHWTGLDDDAKKFEWTGTCYKHAIFGPVLQNGDVQGTAERCWVHKLVNDVNNHNSRCTDCKAALGWCWATRVNMKNDICASCKGATADAWFPLMRQSLVVGYFLQYPVAAALLAGATIIHESREKLLDEDKLARIDVRIDCADDTVNALEIDEESHRGRHVCDEQQRMCNIFQIPGKRTRLVRVNTDRPDYKIAEKISRAAVKALVEEKGQDLSLNDKLAMPEVYEKNLQRTAKHIKEALEVPTGHVIYLDYPLDSPHLVVGNVSLVGRSGVEIRDARECSDGYADMIIVPQELILRLHLPDPHRM
jgi:hypothetical protein